MIQQKIFNLLNFEFKGNITKTPYNGVYVSYDGKDAVIGYTTKTQEARCYFLLSMKLNNGETSFEIKETPAFELCGPMLDMSRGGVMRAEAVKAFIDKSAALGLNMLMLYTEDTYTVEGYPMFGYMRGRYTPDEIREIDSYAISMGVELIPCIQTLGHMGNYFRWGEASAIKENDRVLLPDEDETYAFIEAEIKAVKESFTSKQIHIGMDEAVGLGFGKYYKKHGLHNKLDIFNKHLKRVLDIVKKYDLKPIIWGDMYLCELDDNDYYNPDAVIPQRAIDNAPQNTELMIWDYYHTDYDYYHKKLAQFERFPNRTSFAGGIWTWDGFVPYFTHSLNTMRPALEASIDHGVKTVLATMWNNGGCETDYHLAVDGLAIFSEMCYKGKDCTLDDIYDAAAHIGGMDKDMINALSDFNLGFEGSVGLGKAFFYTDPLINLLCYDISYDKVKESYEKALEIINKHKSYRYYDYYSTLFEIVLKKADIVLNLQKEYKSGNRAYLYNAANVLIPELQTKYRDFYRVFSANWLKSFKAFGYEVFPNRFGSIDYRLSYASKVINDYLNGEASKIEELEPEILPGINQTWRYAMSYMNTNVYA